jgi:hypothetical protein
MRATTRLAAIALVLLLQGCKGASSATNAEGAGGAASSAHGTKTDYITDPTLNNMNAASVTLPARWAFQGMLFQGGSCNPIPTPVYRATSPDGLSYVEELPLMGWKWIAGPLSQYAGRDDCLQISGPMSAQNFLRFIAPLLNTDYLQDEPVPAELKQLAERNLQSAGSNGGNARTSRELARAIVTLRNGSFTLRARLGAMVDCTATFFPGMKSYLRGIADTPGSTVNKCMAKVYLYAAPEKQYEALIRTWDAPGMGATELADWAQAWVHRNQMITAGIIHDISVKSEQSRQAIHDQYQHNMEVQQQMHEKFLHSMQDATARSMDRARIGMENRATMTSDVVDYALDRRTTVDHVTGELVRTPNQATVVWGNTQGDIFSSKDPTADPRGILPGDWSQQNFTHGNGAPMQ